MFKAVAIAAKVIAPATVERPLAISVDGHAQSLLPVLRLVREPPGLAEIDLVSQLRASRISDGQRSLRSFGDEPSLFLRQRGVEMSMTDQHPAQFGDDEGRVAPSGGPDSLSSLEIRMLHLAVWRRRGPLPIEGVDSGVGVVAGFRLDELRDDGEGPQEFRRSR